MKLAKLDEVDFWWLTNKGDSLLVHEFENDLALVIHAKQINRLEKENTHKSKREILWALHIQENYGRV